MIQETSRRAYIELPAGVLQDKIMLALAHNSDLTNQEIAQIIGRDASTISGMNVPLRRIGKIAESRKRRCAVTGRMVIAWKSLEGNSFPPAFKPKESKLKNISLW